MNIQIIVAERDSIWVNPATDPAETVIDIEDVEMIFTHRERVVSLRDQLNEYLGEA